MLPQNMTKLERIFLQRSPHQRVPGRPLALRADYGDMVRVMRNFLRAGLQADESEDDGGLREACTSLFASGRRSLFAYGEHDRPLIRDFSDNIATYVGVSGRSECAQTEPDTPTRKPARQLKGRRSSRLPPIVAGSALRQAYPRAEVRSKAFRRKSEV